ncbi:acylneuraminate cytidylyltransferase [Mucilaginibacter sp. PAMC 26640]|nr:acylneuraminate cytidylyltransferase [Mucilaginibacter sp. PAMC 26640]
MNIASNIVIVVQARMSSTRLPGKVMMPVLGKTLLARMVERLQQSGYPATIVIAIPDAIEDNIIEQEVHRLGLQCFRGNMNNLLDRHYRAAKAFNADVVLKIPSDCPLIDPKAIDQSLGYFFANNYDFVSNLHPATWPDGNDVEIMTMPCLEKTWHEASSKLELEHTTPYIWENTQKFSIGNVAWATGFDYSMSHRFTIDYPEDYEFITRIYEELHPANPNFSCEDILLLLAAKPELFNINKKYAGVNWYRHHLNELKTVSAAQTKLA